MATMIDAHELGSADAKWVQSNTTYRTINPQTVQIDVPFLDSFSDEISIYVIAQADNTLLVTDDGWTLSNLADLGVNFQGANAKLLQQQLNAHQISVKDQALHTITNKSDFPIAKNRLLQTILSLNTLFMSQR